MEKGNEINETQIKATKEEKIYYLVEVPVIIDDILFETGMQLMIELKET